MISSGESQTLLDHVDIAYAQIGLLVKPSSDQANFVLRHSAVHHSDIVSGLEQRERCDVPEVAGASENQDVGHSARTSCACRVNERAPLGEVVTRRVRTVSPCSQIYFALRLSGATSSRKRWTSLNAFTQFDYS